MSTYVININEKSKRGKDLRRKLLQDKELRMMTIDDYEAMEEEVIGREIEKAKKTRSYSYEESKKILAQLRKKLQS